MDITQVDAAASADLPHGVATAPPRPILALTLALAGKRVIPDTALADLTESLKLAFHAIAVRLEAFADGARRPEHPLAARFGDQRPPRLTLVTGLADGVDQLAADIFLSDRAGRHVDHVLGAVLPCGRDDFLANSRVEDVETFERQWSACDFVVELDGDMPPSASHAVPADGGRALSGKEQARIARERADAFTGQSEVLLRQADILVAVDNPNQTGRAGGTRETVLGALELGVPVILLHLGEPGLAVLRTRGDFDEPVMLPPGAAHLALTRLVDDLIGASPSTGESVYVAGLFEQFFAAAAPPPGPLNRFWDRFEVWFKTSRGPFDYYLRRTPRAVPTASPAAVAGVPPQPGSGQPAQPYEPYKQRASDLSAYYAGQYRGAFLAGYLLAVVAVAAAVLSLALSPLNAGRISDPWWWCLLLLGLLKVGVVYRIFRLAERANKERLAHRAADFRYLSERLRAMTYLPLAACLRAPAPWSLPYTTRVSAQGVMDQLFAAIVRQARPIHAIAAAVDGKVLRLDADRAMTAIREDWLADQVGYHVRNQRKLQAMSHWLERLGRAINAAVIAIAGADVLLLAVEALHLLPEPGQSLLHHLLAATLIGFAAVLPAAVASVNGVRFQSECTRLADRSLQMAQELAQLETRSWKVGFRPVRIADALHLATDAARLMLDEVAEWSAIYGKEFIEM